MLDDTEQRRDLILQAEQAIRALAGELARTATLAQEAEAARAALQGATDEFRHVRAQVEDVIAENRTVREDLLTVAGQAQEVVAQAEQALSDASTRLVDASEHLLRASREARDATVRVSAQLRRLQLMVALNLVLALALLAAVLIALR